MFINEIVGIFQDIETFMEIQVKRGHARRYYTSFCKVKIMIIRTAVRSIARTFDVSFLHL